MFRLLSISGSLLKATGNPIASKSSRVRDFLIPVKADLVSRSLSLSESFEMFKLQFHMIDRPSPLRRVLSASALLLLERTQDAVAACH